MMTAEWTESVYLAWLASVRMPADYLRELLNQFGSGEAIFRSVECRDETILETLPRIYRDRLIQNMDESRFAFYRKVMSENGIRVMTTCDAGFPDILQEIPDPVSILFYQGNPECLSGRTISMVGSRAASYSGLKATREIARELSLNGITIVSGFAYGIDTASHQGCIEGGSPTAAVMGCGLDQNYPADHGGLRRTVLDTGGILLSEYAPGEKPIAVNFPYRNRIISGLGQALVLMEAKIRSGSLRTVDHALAQGREVFVYPGDPASPHFEGNHQLLREGGHYFTSAHDILEDMNWLDKKPRDVQNSGCTGSGVNISPEQERIRKLLIPGALSFDQLADQSGMLPAQLMSLLTMMQISGAVEPLPGKKYQLKQ